MDGLTVALVGLGGMIYLSKNKNYNIKSFSEWTDIVGGVEGIVKNPSGNYLNCYDVRRNSQASGFF